MQVQIIDDDGRVLSITCTARDLTSEERAGLDMDAVARDNSASLEELIKRLEPARLVEYFKREILKDDSLAGTISLALGKRGY